MKRVIFLLLVVLFPFRLHAQVVKSVTLNPVMVEAVSKGFSVADFIEMVKSDTSFLRGFRNLRNSSHQVQGNMIVYGKKRNVKATRNRTATQQVSHGKRWISSMKETTTGDFYDRHEIPETYTAEIFDDVFFYKDTVPVVSVHTPVSTTSGNDSNIEKLKKLIFNPGANIEGVPIVGKRMAIFDDDLARYYDYHITTETYQDSIPCYLFSCKAKPDAGDKAVVKTLNTWFDRRSFNIVYRDYRLQYSGLLFDFDVTMKIVMDTFNGVLYPAAIDYKGFWDVPLKRQETIDFDLRFGLLPN